MLHSANAIQKSKAYCNVILNIKVISHEVYYSACENRCIMYSVALKRDFVKSGKIAIDDVIRVLSALQLFNRKPGLPTGCIEFERWGSLPGREHLTERCIIGLSSVLELDPY